MQLITCTSRAPPEPHTQKSILKLKTQRPPILELDTATPQHTTTTQGHAVRTICLCINSYKSAEQMTCVYETIAPPPAARRCSEETFFVLVLVAVRFALWTTMAELCFSVDDFFILDFFSNAAAATVPVAVVFACGVCCCIACLLYTSPSPRD